MRDDLGGCLRAELSSKATPREIDTNPPRCAPVISLDGACGGNSGLGWERSKLQCSMNDMLHGIAATTGVPRSSLSSSLKRFRQTPRISLVMLSRSRVQAPGSFKALLADEPRGSDGDGSSLGPSCGHAGMVTRLFS